MERLSTTPFGARPVSAALLQTVERIERKAEIPHTDKWSLFRDLCTARHAFGVSDRDLTVLNALLTFHRETTLSDNQQTIVFPSNAALCDRAHGMAESTLRRHLAALVEAGLLLRHDSPNGKRYAHKDASGVVVCAFGFDLRPLLLRAREIAVAAAETKAAELEMKRKRERLTLTLRDANKLIEYKLDCVGDARPWLELLERCTVARRAARRKLDADALDAELSTADELLEEVTALMRHGSVIDSEEMSGNGRVSERHYQNSNTYPYESECLEKSKAKPEPARKRGAQGREAERQAREIPFGLVRQACPEMATYAKGRLSDWRDLIRAAHFVRGMMGVSPSAWDEAIVEMGEVPASVTLACMLERITEIRSPGGYLRSLSRKAAAGTFSPIPMVTALLNTSGR
ncbi:MAG: plasmid replication protein RepC [Pseudomonadota bacterium]